MRVSNAFKRNGDPLPDTYAHCCESIPAAIERKFERRRACNARTGHTEWMSKSNRAAVRVDTLVVVGDSEIAQHSQALRCKCLVRFDDVEGISRDTGTRAEPPCRRSRTNIHDAGRNTCRTTTTDARYGREAIFFNGLL